MLMPAAVRTPTSADGAGSAATSVSVVTATVEALDVSGAAADVSLSAPLLVAVAGEMPAVVEAADSDGADFGVLDEQATTPVESTATNRAVHRRTGFDIGAA